jgi:hypothetical protein
MISLNKTQHFLFLVLSIFASTAFALPHKTIVWLSVDGVKPNYLTTENAPFLTSLIQEGAFSSQVRPAFPSSTFAGHLTQATGTSAGVHGIVDNKFFDTQLNQVFIFPDDASLVDAESIWTTVKRQGIRVASIDWPLSHKQTGPWAADYFLDRFDATLSDGDRLEKLLTIYKNDANPRSLQLIMGYITATDSEGHRYGPNTPEVYSKLKQVDRDIENFVKKFQAQWTRTAQANDELYFVFSTDHGMSLAHTAVHSARLAEVEGFEGLLITHGGPVAHLFFSSSNTAAQRRSYEQKLRQKLRDYPFAKLYRKDQLPPQWGLEHPTRTGDLVIVLDLGYAFNNTRPLITYPLTPNIGTIGVHGYDPFLYPEMQGFLLVWRYGQKLPKSNLGPIRSSQMHATIAQLLGVQASEKADQEVIAIKKQ